MADPGNIACKEPYPVHCNFYCENIIELWESCKNNTDDLQIALELKGNPSKRTRLQILLAIIGSANSETFLADHKYHLCMLGQRKIIKSMYLMNYIQKQLEIKCSLRNISLQVRMADSCSIACKELYSVTGNFYFENINELFEVCLKGWTSRMTHRSHGNSCVTLVRELDYGLCWPSLVVQTERPS